MGTSPVHPVPSLNLIEPAGYPPALFQTSETRNSDDMFSTTRGSLSVGNLVSAFGDADRPAELQACPLDLSVQPWAQCALPIKTPELIHLAVTGMTCAKCVGRVQRALRCIPGVVEVTVDLDNETARVEGSAGVSALLAALAEAGYPSSAVGGHSSLAPGATSNRAPEDGPSSGEPEQAIEDGPSSGAPEQAIDLSVSGMTCDKCVGRVEGTLLRVPGVASVKVDLVRARARVVGSVSATTLVAALSSEGYPSKDLRGPIATSGPCDGGASVTKSTTSGPVNHERPAAELWVGGMTCGKCVGRVERALLAVAGTVSVKVDLQQGRARVKGSAAVCNLVAALADSGYPAGELMDQRPPSVAQTSAGGGADTARGVAGAPMVATVELAVGGMTCGKCVERVERALRAVAGVVGVTVHLVDGQARVEGTAAAGELIAALSDAGYPAAEADCADGALPEALVVEGGATSPADDRMAAGAAGCAAMMDLAAAAAVRDPTLALFTPCRALCVVKGSVLYAPIPVRASRSCTRPFFHCSPPLQRARYGPPSPATPAPARSCSPTHLHPAETLTGQRPQP